MKWDEVFTERELKEIEFCEMYAKNFQHGTDGHNAKMIIAKLVTILKANEITEVPPFLAPVVK